jgi:hypothetical protein
MLTQAQLFDPPLPHKLTAEEAFLAFHHANPWVYDRLVEYARTAKNLGFKRYSLRTLWENLRWTADRRVKRLTKGYKFNDHYPPFYARMIMAREHDLADFFEVRRHA